jgi:hypothetical protein
MKANVILTIDGKTHCFKSTESATSFLMRHNELVKKQREFTLAKLLRDGSISRNFALSHFFTRLSARICELRDEGYEISGDWDDEHRDYIYTLIKKKQ